MNERERESESERERESPGRDEEDDWGDSPSGGPRKAGGGAMKITIKPPDAGAGARARAHPRAHGLEGGGRGEPDAGARPRTHARAHTTPAHVAECERAHRRAPALAAASVCTLTPSHRSRLPHAPRGAGAHPRTLAGAPSQPPHPSTRGFAWLIEPRCEVRI